MIWCTVAISISLVSVSCAGLTPVYSPSYANVYYQGSSRHNSGSSSRDMKEEVTEPPDGFDEVNPTIDTDTATEPFSESINITKNHNLGPRKLHEAIELDEELEPTQRPDLEPTDSPVLEAQGIYYIYHPSGLLQQVVFTTRDDLQNMEYSANFDYHNVKPIVEPIYTYDSNTLQFQRLQLDV